jgi:hypothetical protein
MAADDERSAAGHEGEDVPTPSGQPTAAADRVLETAMAFWQSAVLVTAHELGLFAALATGPRDAGTLEQCLGVRPGAITDLLDAVLMLGLVEQSDDQYRNAPEARHFLDPTQPSYIGRWLAMAGAAMREMAELTARLRAVSATEGSATELSSLSDQTWTDIAALLRAARGHGDA